MRTLLMIAGCLSVVASCATLLGIDKEYVEAPEDAGLGDAAVRDSAAEDAIRTDATALDAAGDSGDAGCQGVVCNGTCLPGEDCSGCSAATLYCAASHACVSDCTACSSESIECWSCPAGGGRRGSCEELATPAYCLGGAYDHCGCDGGLNACPGAAHLCASGICVNCGAAGASTDGKPCAGGLTCEASKRLCHD
jgi:hypothetical protein